MTDIGRSTPSGVLYLPAVGDWNYTFSVEGTPLNPSWRLYIAIGNAPTPSVVWEFVISPDGKSASITVESTVVQAIPLTSRFWLMLQTSVGNPPGVELLTGKIVRG